MQCGASRPTARTAHPLHCRQIFNRKGDLLFYKARASHSRRYQTRISTQSHFLTVILRSGRERRARPRRWRTITSSCLASSSRSSSSSTRWRRAGAAIATRSLPIATPPHPSLPLLSSGGGLHACSTSTYKLHYFETASGPPPCRHSRLSRFVSLRRGPCSLCRPPLRPLHRRIPASARAACHRQTPKATAFANRTRRRRLARDAAAAVCRHLR